MCIHNKWAHSLSDGRNQQLRLLTIQQTSAWRLVTSNFPFCFFLLYDVRCTRRAPPREVAALPAKFVCSKYHPLYIISTFLASLRAGCLTLAYHCNTAFSPAWKACMHTREEPSEGEGLFCFLIAAPVANGHLELHFLGATSSTSRSRFLDLCTWMLV
jgi:hypothetical protein